MLRIETTVDLIEFGGRSDGGPVEKPLVYLEPQREFIRFKFKTSHAIRGNDDAVGRVGERFVANVRTGDPPITTTILWAAIIMQAARP